MMGMPGIVLHRSRAVVAPGSTGVFGLGSSAAPSVTFIGRTTIGIFSSAADTVAISSGSSTAATFSSGGISLNRPLTIPNSGSAEITFSGDTQTEIRSDASMIFTCDRDNDGAGAHTIEFHGGTSGCRMRIHDSPLVVQLGDDSNTPAEQQIKSADALSSAVGSNFHLKPGESAGTDQAGGVLLLSGGQSTGAGTPGYVAVQSVTAGASGADVRSLVERGRLGAQILWGDGLVTAPAHSFLNEPDCGIYVVGTNNIALATAGVRAIDISASQRIGIGNQASATFKVAVEQVENGSSTFRVLNTNNGASAGAGIHWSAEAAGASITLWSTGASATLADRLVVALDSTASGLTFLANQTGQDIRMFAGSGTEIARWTTGGTSTTGQLRIGAVTTELGKVQIVGTADEIQLFIRGNATQTAQTVQIQNSAATILFNIDNSGRFSTSSGVASGPAWRFLNDADTGVYFIGDANLGMSVAGTLRWDWNATRLLFSEGYNLQAGTATGTKIGVTGGASGEKWAFFGASPIVQPLLATGGGATVDNVITVLQNLGLCRQS